MSCIGTRDWTDRFPSQLGTLSNSSNCMSPRDQPKHHSLNYIKYFSDLLHSRRYVKRFSHYAIGGRNSRRVLGPQSPHGSVRIRSIVVNYSPPEKIKLMLTWSRILKEMPGLKQEFPDGFSKLTNLEDLYAHLLSP